MNEEGKLPHACFMSCFLVSALFGLSWSLWSGSELVEYFRAQMRKDPDMASAVAAIRTLLEFLRRDKGVFHLITCFIFILSLYLHYRTVSEMLLICSNRCLITY